MDESSLSLNKSTFVQRQSNLKYLRWLYFYLALQMLLILTWSSCVLAFETLSDPIRDYWYIALITGCIAIIILLICSFVTGARSKPLNYVLYILWILTWGYTMAYFCAENSNRLVFFGLMLMTAISVAFELYAVCSSNYMQTLSAIVFILGCTLVILQSFIIWTTVDIVYIGLVYVSIIIFGFYLNYDIRRMVRGSLYDSQKEDPVTGAIRIWLETTFVFCRMVELAGGMCIKDKH